MFSEKKRLNVLSSSSVTGANRCRQENPVRREDFPAETEARPLLSSRTHYSEDLPRVGSSIFFTDIIAAGVFLVY
jgi:hypothetical protein